MPNKLSSPQQIKLGVFISGRGSNLKAILDACKTRSFPAQVKCIISNNPSAEGLKYADEYKIPFAIISHRDFESKQAFEQALLDALKHEPVDLICLAGFMRILSPYFLEKWGPNIINIHPSLLPKYKGLDTHARAIKAGDPSTGCSVHYVTPEMDSGEIIAQQSISILKKDTPDSLAARLLPIEHQTYIDAIKLVANKMIGTQQEFQLLHQTSPKKTALRLDNQYTTSKGTWDAFAQGLKYACLSLVGILTLLALFLF